jgi:hypothetical protein
MFSISQVIRQFKQQWTRQLDERAIEQACLAAGMRWRERVLTPVCTMRLFLLQILWGNTACDHVPRLAGLDFTGEAYCKARARIPLAVFRDLLRRLTDAMLEAVDREGLWRGHRLWLLDGTSFSMPDTPKLQAHFGQPGGQRAGCGFPVAHCLALVHAGSGLVRELITAPLRTHDLSRAAHLHEHLRAGDLLVADRAFASYAHFALLHAQGVQMLARAHQKLIIDFSYRRPHLPPGVKRTKADRGKPYSRWLFRWNKQDQVVIWYKPTSRPAWMSMEQYADLPESLAVRELRYRITRPGCRVREITLLTTLLSAETYPAEALAELYRQRWRIETNFAHLKTTLDMDVLHCKTVEGVEKETLMFVLVYNLVRMVMCQAAARQGVDVDRISFVDALRWLQSASPHEPLPRLLVNPLRPGRQEPRVRKRRPKQYPVMKRPRWQLKQELVSQSVTA